MKKKLQLGNLTLDNPVIYSPLAGCSDYPFRKVVAPYRPGLFFCEMVKMDALVRHDENTYHLLDYDTDMHPIGAQLCGSKVELAAESSRIIEDLGFDVVDLNCGCPVDKVTKDGSGSGLLKQPQKIGEILNRMVNADSIPVTVKIRAGWDENSINAPLITQIAEAAGAAAISIHGRTRSQAYRGPAIWSHITKAVDARKTIKVLGNGDVLCGPSALQMMQETGCDGVLVSRGTFGQPWIVQEILEHFNGNKFSTPSIQKALLNHFYAIANYEEGRRAVVSMRRVSCWYLRPITEAKPLREGINKASSLSEIESLIKTFPFDRIATCQR